MDEIEQTVSDASKPIEVRRRETGVFGSDGRLAPAAETIAIVPLVVQHATGTALVRAQQGDTTAGALSVWGSMTRMAEAYAQGDVTETPLGWTALRVCPPRDASGPPGDRVVWHGREYEITSEEQHDDDGLIQAAAIRRYLATERRAA